MSAKKLNQAFEKILRASPLLKELSGLELKAVMELLEPRSVKNGKIIFKEGAEGEEMFIIVSGEADAIVSQADGTKRRMFGLKTGDFFGEMSIIANESRSATLIAKGEMELAALHGMDFYRIIFEYPMIGVKLLRVIRNVQNTWLEQTSKHLGDIMRWGETARRRAVTDELTGLYNRRFLEESANDRFEKGAVGRLRNLSLMMMDLDKIHEVNTRYGNKAGDMVFVSTADVLRSTTRTGDICARLSGDEFAILLPDTGPQGAKDIAEKVRQSIASKKVTIPKVPDSKSLVEIIVRTSIGIACAPLHTDCWDGLFLAADSALRRSKELGRNRVEIVS